MAVILDTNALSALAARDPSVRGRLAPASRVAVTLISLGEYHYGLIGSTHRTELEEWLAAFMAHSELLVPGLQTLPHYAAIRHELKTAGTPIPANDVWIAALARESGMSLLSRDRHFDLVKGIQRVDW